MLTKFCRTKSGFSPLVRLLQPVCGLHYEQGQSPKPNIREYFYFIDHQGQVGIMLADLETKYTVNLTDNSMNLWSEFVMKFGWRLFMDDARIKNFTSCFKEKKFLEFFFKRLKINDSGRYEQDFPYQSPCGREKNYIRVDDRPIVFTHVVETSDGNHELLYNHAGDLLTSHFHPQKVCMIPATGRVYHPAPEKTGGIGLIKSSLAIELSKMFHFSHGDETEAPTHLTFKGKKYELDNELVTLMESEEERFRLKIYDQV